MCVVSGVQTRDVPADGDCLFHATGREAYLALHKTHSFNDPAAATMAPGAYFRERVAQQAALPYATLDGTPVAEWIKFIYNKSVPEYVRHLRDSSRPWGVFSKPPCLSHRSAPTLA